MPTSFLQERATIMEALWAAQNRAAPDYDSVELAEAGRRTAKELERLLSKHREGQVPAELGLTWRYLGDAWFCASRKTDQDCIAHSVAAYDRAEALFSDSGREVDLAKLRFNQGNALRQVTGEGQLAALEKAQKLYHSALLIFRRLLPEGVAATEASLRDVETALRAYEMLEWGQKDHDRIQQLRQKLEAADPEDDEALRREISREIQAMKADEMTDEIRSFMGTLSTYRSDPDPEKWEEQLPALDELAAEVRNEKPIELNEALEYLRLRLAIALQESHLSGKRAKTLKVLLAEAESLGKQSPQTAKARAAFEGEVRDLVVRAKPVLLGREHG